MGASFFLSRPDRFFFPQAMVERFRPFSQQLFKIRKFWSERVRLVMLWYCICNLWNCQEWKFFWMIFFFNFCNIPIYVIAHYLKKWNQNKKFILISVSHFPKLKIFSFVHFLAFSKVEPKRLLIQWIPFQEESQPFLKEHTTIPCVF